MAEQGKMPDARRNIVDAFCIRGRFKANGPIATEFSALVQANLDAYRREVILVLRPYLRHLDGCKWREWECGQPGCGETHHSKCTCGLERLAEEK